MYIGGWIVGAFLVGFAGLNRKGGYFRAFFLSLALSPIGGLLFTLGAARKNAVGCAHCGNEAEYCGVCGKNAIGELKPGWIERKKS